MKLTENYIKNVLLSLICTLFVVANSSFLIFGQIVSYLSILMGLAGMVVLVWCKCCYSFKVFESVVKYIFIILCIELFQLLRGQDVFDFERLVMRGMTYCIFLCAATSSYEGFSFVNKLTTEKLWKIITGLVCLLSLLYIALSFTGRGGGNNGRFVSDESLNPVGVATVYSSLLCILVLAGLLHKAWFWRFTSYLGAAVSLYAVVLTGSRGGLAAALVVISLILYLIFRGRDKKKFNKVLYFFIALCVAAGVATTKYADKFSKISNRFQSIGSDSDLSGDARISYWQELWECSDEWLLFGWSQYSGKYPHNMFYELALRFGVLGMAISIGVLVIGFRIFKVANEFRNHVTYLCATMFFFNFLAAMTSLGLEHQKWLAWSIGIYFAFRALQKQLFVSLTEQ